MSSGWQTHALDDIAEIISGGTPKTSNQEYWGGEIPWLSVADFNNDRRYVRTTEKTITDLGLNNSATKLLFPGDIIISARGTVGVVAQIGYPMAFNQSCYGVRALDHLITPDFLYYTLKCVSNDLKQLANGGVFDTIIRETFTRINIQLPSFKEQNAITGVLNSLDACIENLRETNTTLETIAQTLFKSWFIDFDPVHAKVEGCEPAGMDAETASLFPDSFDESRLGKIPMGWSVVSFLDTIHVIGGGTPKTSIPEYWNGDIPWFSVVDAPTKTDVFVIDTEKHITASAIKNSSTKLLSAGTTIISARGTVGRLALVGKAMAMNQSCYGLVGKAGDSFFTFYSTSHLVELLKQNGHGSVFNTITRDTFASISVVYPKKEIINKFEAVLFPIMERIKKNNEQVRVLSDLRDRLLPKLISGQICLLSERDKAFL